MTRRAEKLTRASLCGIIMVLCLAACAARKCGTGSFSFELDSYNGSMAYGLTYKVEDDALTVTFVGDLEGEKPKVVLSRSLSEDERRASRASLTISSVGRGCTFSRPRPRRPLPGR